MQSNSCAKFKLLTNISFVKLLFDRQTHLTRYHRSFVRYPGVCNFLQMTLNDLL